MGTRIIPSLWDRCSTLKWNNAYKCYYECTVPHVQKVYSKWQQPGTSRFIIEILIKGYIKLIIWTILVKTFLCTEGCLEQGIICIETIQAFSDGSVYLYGEFLRPHIKCSSSSLPSTLRTHALSTRSRKESSKLSTIVAPAASEMPVN